MKLTFSKDEVEYLGRTNWRRIREARTETGKWWYGSLGIYRTMARRYAVKALEDEANELLRELASEPQD